MAGHSHWHNTHQQKEKANASRGVIFTKVAQQIIMAAREGGGDPDHNLGLRIAVDYARSVNMPKDNIDRAIKKGAGGDATVHLEKALYEGFGPNKVPFIISAITDNKNRTVSELRSMFLKAGGELGSSGAVMWQFTESGRITVQSVKIKRAEKFGETDTEVPVNRDEAMLDLMDVPEVEDIEVDEDTTDQLFVKAPINRLAQVGQFIKEKGYVIVSSGLHFAATNPIELPEDKHESFMTFFETLENQQDVQHIWHGAI